MKEKKNIILIIIIIILFGGAITYFLVNNTDKSNNAENITTNDIKSSDDVKIDSKGNKENIAVELKHSQTSLGILLSSVDITSKAEYPREATIKLNLRNLTSVDMKNFKLKVDFIDKKGNVLTTVFFPVDLLKANEGLELSNTVTHRVIDAHEYRFEKVE